MAFLKNGSLVPPLALNPEGIGRRVGVEIELANIEPQVLAECVITCFGGDITLANRIEYLVSDTRYGKFQLELDASYLKALGELQLRQQGKDTPISDFTIDLIASAAELLVPWEVVTPPIPIAELQALHPFISLVRDKGALGTRHALHFAFGVHFNPELPALDADTILRYLRAYFCAYEWIAKQEQIDLTRALSSYVQHFSKTYILKVLDPDYQPDMDQLIDDYLEFNPSRNRSLDLLPLFAHIDRERVVAAVDDPRVKSRPTFHYRLPNCDIDNPEWGLEHAWKNWLAVEYLVVDESRLRILCEDYAKELDRITHLLEDTWPTRIEHVLNEIS